MPTKRFESLDPERRQQLLHAAATEFAGHGYEAASFNRIIERAGTSKGAIYYYFEDKADLYATVVREAVGRFVTYCGPPPVVQDTESFWAAIREMSGNAIQYYRRDPHIAGIVRSLGRDGLQVGPVAEIRHVTTTFFTSLLVAGQAVGAVRTDLPVDLMLGIATSVSEGFDLWLANHATELSEAEIDGLADQITNLYRRMATPEEVP